VGTSCIFECNTIFSPFSSVRQSSWLVSRRGNQWYPRVQTLVQKRGLYHDCPLDYWLLGWVGCLGEKSTVP
jgi:hypothetical protein